MIRRFVLMITILFVLTATVNAGDIQTIRIATPSWEDQTNKDGTGLFFDIVRAVYGPVGITMKYEFVPWERAKHTVEHGSADAMLCMWKQHASENGFITPKYPMFVEYTGAVFHKDTFKDWSGIPSLQGKTAIWLRGYGYDETDQLKDVGMKWSETDTHDSAWKMLMKNRVEVYIDAMIDVDRYIRAHDIDMNAYRKEILWGENAYIAFNDTEKGRELARIFDERITEVYRSGKLKEIFDTWQVAFHPEAWKAAKQLIGHVD